MEKEHFKIYMKECDYNFDGTVDECEVEKCAIDVENKYRAKNCPKKFGKLTCRPNPNCPPKCKG